MQIENVQAKYSSARSQFKLDERTLPGLADERLRLVAEQIVPEPFLREAGEDEATYMERAFRRVLHEIGDLGALRRALSGERLSDPDQGTFDRLVAFLRSELELLHNEVVDRVRVERSSFRHKAVDRFRGASKWTIGAVATVLITLIVTGIVGVATDWFG